MESLQRRQNPSKTLARNAASAERPISFPPFHLYPAQRLLLDAGKPLRLGSRALDILIALVERPGELIGKDELIARVWPNTFVEGGNLKVHIAALRRALGDGQDGRRYIATAPGRGYCFVAPIARSGEPISLAPLSTDASSAHNLPARLGRMIGRADTVRVLAGQLPRQRFVTMVGPGGIGKTTVALAVGEAMVAAYEHGVWFVDFGPLSDSFLVPSALASALGVESRADNPMPAVLAFLRDKQMLLVLDNCEHVIGPAAVVAAEILKAAPRAHILATSREPLRAAGEHVHRLSPLETPPATPRLTAAEALCFPSIQLFAERAAEAQDEFALSDANASIVADICRRLDGIALAIELAAARIGTLGVSGLAARLDDRFRLLTNGRRTALPRHQTLRATLDWSYEWLSEQERKVLRRLAIFESAFTLDAASAVGTGGPIAAPDVVDCVANLVAKSLIVADVGDTIVHYRLLETTRAYALEKLAESGEVEALARCHDECCAT